MKRIALPNNVAPIAVVALLHAAAIWAVAVQHATSVQEPQPMEISLELDAEAPPAAATTRRAATQTSATPTSPSAPTPVQSTPAQPTARAATITPPLESTKPETVPAVQASKSSADDNAPSGIPTNTAAAVSGAPGHASASTATLANAAALQLPSSDADYLNNPKPAYPPMSRRLGEQGTVVVRALIGTDGNAQKAEVQQSSGFERLDRAALETALKWRYLPGKRAGVPEAMWFKVPLRFVLE